MKWLVWFGAAYAAVLTGLGLLAVPAVLRDRRDWRDRRRTLAAWDRYIEDLVSRSEAGHSFWLDQD